MYNYLNSFFGLFEKVFPDFCARAKIAKVGVWINKKMFWELFELVFLGISWKKFLFFAVIYSTFCMYIEKYVRNKKQLFVCPLQKFVNPLEKFNNHSRSLNTVAEVE